MLRFVDLLARWLRPVSLEKRTSAAKAVKRACIYGTAEAVPFVERRFFPQHFSPCDPDEHFVQDAPSQGLKPDVFSINLRPDSSRALIQSMRAVTP